MKRRREAAILAALALSACASGAQHVQGAVSTCQNGGAFHTEVYIPQATVVRVIGERAGRSGEHEGFIIRTSVRTFKVEDNVNITGPIPLHRGDVVSLLGQLECDDFVIHWTHHDPRGRHVGGYIEVHGNRYQ